MAESYKRLIVKRSGGILTVALSSPEKRNAVDGAMHAELPHLMREVANDRSIGVVVITGDPAGRAFCAGGDMAWMDVLRGDGNQFGHVLREGAEVLRSIIDAPQPVISMVNGAAMGLGATIALVSDVCFIDETAKIADTHVSVGVVAGDGGAVLWPLLIGPNRAKEFLMTGDVLTGKQAAEIGLVNHAVPAAELEAKTYAFAERLANGPRLAIEFTKRSVNIFVRSVLNQIIDGSLALEGLTFQTENHREAVDAFLGKRKPNFKNP
jgi:enoyl-CoA hydratase